MSQIKDQYHRINAKSRRCVEAPSYLHIRQHVGITKFSHYILIVRPTADITEVSVLCWLYVESSRVGALLAPAMARNN